MLFDFLCDWDKEFYRFTRDIKDMNPYEIINDKNQLTIVHNVVGLGKDDIEISVERDKYNDYLTISGEKKNETTNKIYKVDSRFIINLDEIDENGIEYKVKDGLLYIFIKLKKPEQPKINIRYRD